MPRSSQRPSRNLSAPEDIEFLRRRVGTYGLYVGATGAAALVVRQVLWEALDHPESMWVQPSTITHAIAASIFLGVWLLCWKVPLGRTGLIATEGLAMLLGGTAYIAMGLSIPLEAFPHYIVVMILTMGLVARSAVVPSPPLRTVAIGVILGIDLVAAFYWWYTEAAQNDAAVFRFLSEQAVALRGKPASPVSFAQGAAITAGIWWAFVVSLCAFTSHVVYGLQRQVARFEQLGQYVLEEKLGEGGMGVVYRAAHAMLRRPTAVKLLPPEKAGQAALQRFEREVRLTAQLTHPNTVTIFDYGRTPEGVFYYAMEYLNGATLDEVVEADGPMPQDRVVHVLAAAAGALHEAHEVGLVHRDIKPANIMLCRYGGRCDVPKLLDFGLVKEVEGGSDAGLTQTNTLTGTPQYMAPEAILTPDELGYSADLYALGAVGYYLLTGTPVFSGSVVEVCSHHLHSEPEPPSKRVAEAVNRELELLVLACLSKDPNDRPGSALELREALLKLRTGEWSEQKSREWWDTHEPAIAQRRRSVTPTPGASPTLAVDLGGRRKVA